MPGSAGRKQSRAEILLAPCPLAAFPRHQAVDLDGQTGNEDAAELLLETGANLIDEYMIRGTEDSVFDEPAVIKTGDINAYLKLDKLGKTEAASPHLAARSTSSSACSPGAGPRRLGRGLSRQSSRKSPKAK